MSLSFGDGGGERFRAAGAAGVAGVGWLQYRQLAVVDVGIVAEVARVRSRPRPTRCRGGRTCRTGAARRLRVPRQGAVSQRLGEHDRVAGARGHPLDAGMDALAQVAPLGGQGQIGLVGAGDAAEAALVGMGIEQLEPPRPARYRTGRRGSGRTAIRRCPSQPPCRIPPLNPLATWVGR